jgi:hypothetical protein
MNKSFISRSAFETYDVCARKYYLSYEHKGTGVSPKYYDIDLLVGSCIHRGLQNLLEHCRLDHPNGDFTDTCIEESVRIALDLYDKSISEYDISKKSQREDIGFTLLSHRYLIEALIFSYSYYRLRDFLKEYIILEVEKEEVDVDFSSGKILLGKADFICLKRSNNKIVVGSYKTASEYAESTQRDLLIDMQGNSECYLVGKRYNHLYKKFINSNDSERFRIDNDVNMELFTYFLYCKNNNIDKINVELVQYEHLIKGKRKERVRDSGIYERDTLLLHPYKYDLGLRDTSTLPKHFKLYTGKGKNPANLNKVNIWEHLPIKVWVTWLIENQIQPELGDVLKDIIIPADLIKRGEETQLEWYQSYSKVCDDINTGLLELEHSPQALNGTLHNQDDINKIENRILNNYFRKETKSCTNYYGRDCIYFNICHNNWDLNESIEDGLYQTRKPHHDDEMNLFIEKGYIKNNE